jgi:hypothetical protein
LGKFLFDAVDTRPFTVAKVDDVARAEVVRVDPPAGQLLEAVFVCFQVPRGWTFFEVVAINEPEGMVRRGPHPLPGDNQRHYRIFVIGIVAAFHLRQSPSAGHEVKGPHPLPGFNFTDRPQSRSGADQCVAWEAIGMLKHPRHLPGRGKRDGEIRKAMPNRPQGILLQVAHTGIPDRFRAVAVKDAVQ